MTKNPKIAAVPTAFHLEALSIYQPPKYTAPKGTCCRHSCNLDFFSMILMKLIMRLMDIMTSKMNYKQCW